MLHNDMTKKNRFATFLSLLFLIFPSTLSAGPDTINGYGGYTFGMTYAQAERVSPTDKLTKCAHKNAYACLREKITSFGYPATLDAVLDKDAKVFNTIWVSFDFGVNIERCYTASQAILNKLTSLYKKADLVEISKVLWVGHTQGIVEFHISCRNDEGASLKLQFRNTPAPKKNPFS